jgi:NAD-dependent SIR2 family protein deacetylase
MPNASVAARPGEVEALRALLAGRRFVALTGAGCSTESGIPDYRGAGRPGPRNPIQHDAFVRQAHVRRRYWARATLGWERFKTARPNAGHRALAALEAAGLLAGVITQNVDRLHHEAGSRRVVVRPDGDAELSADTVAVFEVVGCGRCGGPLKPEVVFFGGTVPEATVVAGWRLLEAAQALLVAGSSLTVYSGFRFVRRAHELGLPIGIINLGPTRGDELAEARVAAPVGHALPLLATELGAQERGS